MVCVFTCFCRVMRSQSSTSQGFSSSGIFTFTSTRLVNISSWTQTKKTFIFLVLFEVISGVVWEQQSFIFTSSVFKDLSHFFVSFTKTQTRTYKTGRLYSHNFWTYDKNFLRVKLNWMKALIIAQIGASLHCTM